MGDCMLPKPSVKLLGKVPVGDTVKLNLDGIAKEFLVVHHGLPSSLYDSSCDGTWLLMKDIYQNKFWHSTNRNEYQSSTIHSYLISTFLGLFDEDIQALIKTVKIPFVNGTGSYPVSSGSNGLSTKIFLLSGYEVGWTQSNNAYLPIDGACLSYFSGAAATDSKRIGYFNGLANSWWLRSPTTDSTANVYGVTTSGGIGEPTCASNNGVRPALILPDDMRVS